MCLKLFVYGLPRFWSSGQCDAAKPSPCTPALHPPSLTIPGPHRRYGAGKTFEQWENRTALVISGGVLLVWLFSRASPAAYVRSSSRCSEPPTGQTMAPGSLALKYEALAIVRVGLALLPRTSVIGSVCFAAVLCCAS